MRLRKVSVFAAAASVVVLGTGALLSGTASATVAAAPTVTPTATPIQGNVTICQGDDGPEHQKVNLAGTALAGGDDAAGPYDGDGVTASVAGGTTLTVVVEAGTTVTGIVVKAGSEGYNVYTGPFEGEVTVTGMTAPPTGAQGNIPKISHWFVCGERTSTETTTTTTTTGTTTATKPGLPATGASLTGLVMSGVALVAGGVALLLARRRRAAGGE